MSDVHEFDDKKKQSDKHCELLDFVFGQWYETVATPLIVDKMGIDRVWVEKNTRVRYSVEYKADEMTAKTGNAFVETVSIDTEDKPGWAYTCVAQILVYYIPQWRKAWLLSPMAIKNKLEEWKKKYKEVPANNNGYKTLGLLVPWKVFVNGSWAEVDIEEK